MKHIQEYLLRLGRIKRIMKDIYIQHLSKCRQSTCPRFSNLLPASSIAATVTCAITSPPTWPPCCHSGPSKSSPHRQNELLEDSFSHVTLLPAFLLPSRIKSKLPTCLPGPLPPGPWLPLSPGTGHSQCGPAASVALELVRKAEPQIHLDLLVQHLHFHR